LRDRVLWIEFQLLADDRAHAPVIFQGSISTLERLGDGLVRTGRQLRIPDGQKEIDHILESALCRETIGLDQLLANPGAPVPLDGLRQWRWCDPDGFRGIDENRRVARIRFRSDRLAVCRRRGAKSEENCRNDESFAWFCHILFIVVARVVLKRWYVLLITVVVKTVPAVA